MRWANTCATLIGPRDGATLRSIADPAPPRRYDVHIQIHAAKVADQAPASGPAAVRRDQIEPREAGFAIAASNCAVVTPTGMLWGVTIYGPHGRGYSAEDPDAIFASSTGDANAGEPSEPIRAEEASVPPIAPPPRCAALAARYPNTTAGNDLESAMARRNSVASQPCS